tara:strand:- start:563 stop:1252 length:690 start_codon:yes stop_codon:yes gene_type:complete
MINTTKIYLVTNCYGDSNKVYIGKTKSSRKKAHKTTYGASIAYNVIDEIDSSDHKIWKPIETYWIEQFKQWGFNVLNINNGGGGPEKHSDVTKQKMREAHSKIKYSKKNNSKSILQYDLNGNLIKEWSSIIEAKKAGFGGVDMCVIGETKTAGGFLWRHKINPLPKIYKLPNHKSCKPIHQYSKSGEFIKTWNSIKEACSYLNMDPGTITNVCSGGRQKTAYGYIWKYV